MTPLGWPAQPAITKILARYKSSIATVHQDEQMGEDGSVAVKMTTHPTPGTAIKKALGKIGELSTVREGSSVLKFYHGE